MWIYRCKDEEGVRVNLTVKCGEKSLYEGGSGSQTRQVYRIIPHPSYNPRTLVSDLAVLFVDPQFEYSETVGKVCLPYPGETYVGKECMIAGHGKKEFKKTSPYAVEQRKLNITVAERDICEVKLKRDFFDLEEVPNWTLDTSFLCGNKASTEDVCEGDGGSALVYRETQDSAELVQVNNIKILKD